MREPTFSRSHRVIAKLPTHTETWYPKSIPQVGKRFTYRGVEYEVLTLRMEGASFVIEVERPRKRGQLLDDLDPSRTRAIRLQSEPAPSRSPESAFEGPDSRRSS